MSGPEIARFLDEHIQEMKSVSPPESKHALDIEGLKRSEVTVWTVWVEGILVGCGALQQLSREHGEIKSMRTSAACRGRGIASVLLRHIIAEAKQRSYSRISLETGSAAHFLPARKLYHKFGFVFTGPFAEYRDDPNSTYMTLELRD